MVSRRVGLVVVGGRDMRACEMVIVTEMIAEVVVSFYPRS